MEPKKHYCKLGTQPTFVVIWGSTPPAKGHKIKFRLAEHGSKWQWGHVTEVHPDGFFFLDYGVG